MNFREQKINKYDNVKDDMTSMSIWLYTSDNAPIM